MMYTLLLLMMTISLLSSSSANQCQEFGLNDCTGDEAAVIFEVNTSAELCQQYCAITPECTFYRHDSRPIQGVSCSLFGEDFSTYSSHCDEVSAPKDFANTELCLAPSTPSCDTIQVGNCAFWGTIEETNSLSSAASCSMMCSVTPACDMWAYQKQRSQCIMYSDEFPGDNRKCNVVFGPPHTENCQAFN